MQRRGRITLTRSTTTSGWASHRSRCHRRRVRMSMVMRDACLAQSFSRRRHHRRDVPVLRMDRRPLIGSAADGRHRRELRAGGSLGRRVTSLLLRRSSLGGVTGAL